MEHYDIEDSFKRMVVPELRVEYVIREGLVGGGGLAGFSVTVPIDVLLLNESTATARFPYFAMEGLNGATWVLSAQRHGIHPRKVGEVTYFESAVDSVIHPDTSMVIAVLQITIPAAMPESGRSRVLGSPSVSFDFRCGCFNSRQARGRMTIGTDALVERIRGGYIG
jgi:hypothetical protein